MLTSAWKSFPRYEPDGPVIADDATSDGVTPQEHDLILRYAIVGIFVIMATASLQMTKVIAMPVTAGVIFGLVLGPMVDWMVRRGVPQHAAAALVVVAGMVVVASAVTLLAVPLAAWSDQFPAMMAALKSKLSGFFSIVKEVQDATTAVTGAKGMQVSVADGNPLLDIAISSSAAAGGLLVFVATVYFWLATRRHLKARVLRLCLGRDARKSAGSFFEEIEARVARYFGWVTAINLGVGLAAAVVAWWAGLPYPIFWGALAFILNYLAFIGPIIVTALFFAAALLTAPSPFAAVWPAAAFYGLHLIEGNAITPIVVGNRLTVSPFLVFISFVFWLWLWGPVGAVLSTPILLVAMVAREEFVRYRQAVPNGQGTP